jgi:hypothetical protein
MPIFTPTMERGIEVLLELHPSGIFGRNIADYKLNFENFVNLLIEESDFKDNPIELILNPLFNSK